MGRFRFANSREFSYNCSMVDAQVQTELLKQLDQLPIAQQQQVLEYARTLAAQPPEPRGIPFHELLKFAGTISPEDCKAMTEAIEEGCEQVDPDGW